MGCAKEATECSQFQNNISMLYDVDITQSLCVTKYDNIHEIKKTLQLHKIKEMPLIKSVEVPYYE